MFLQVKEDGRWPANFRKPGERHGAVFPSWPQKEPTLMISQISGPTELASAVARKSLAHQTPTLGAAVLFESLASASRLADEMQGVQSPFCVSLTPSQHFLEKQK